MKNSLVQKYLFNNTTKRYLSALDTHMYLSNNTRPDIAFSINLLARYNFSPTKRHWNEIKHIFCYL